jgi:phospholipid/cholesterol/gamma-HCH transport system substrate-binding protein
MPSPSRIVAAGALLLGLVAVAVILLGSSSTYTVKAIVSDGGQLVPGDAVHIGAVTVGSVSRIRLTANGLVELDMSIDSDAAPLRRGTTAAIRATSLLGAANRYVTLAPPSCCRATLPAGDTIPMTDTTAPVDFDALINSFDANTRNGLRLFIHGGALTYQGRTAQASASLKLLAPALSATSGLTAELARDQPALDGLVTQGAAVMHAVAARRRDLADLVQNADVTAAAIARREQNFEQTLTLLPPTLHHATVTFAGLRTMLDQFSRLVAVAQPATRQLAPFLGRLNPLLQQAGVEVPELSAMIARPGPSNDLTDLFVGMPSLALTVHTAAPATVKAMNRSQHLFDLLRANTPDLLALFAELDQLTSYYDANGHYARGFPVLSALGYDPSGNELQPKPRSELLQGFQFGQGHRCPGAAIQPPPDRSAPVAQPGCQLSATPPGP